MNTSISDLESKAHYLRNQLLEMCIKARTGHVTSSLSCAEIFVALFYGGILRYDPSNPDWEGRDRFILSKGHASVILYPVLADLGFFPKERLDKFCQADGFFGVHLQNDVPGVEISSGSLGQGLGVAAGLALAAKMNNESHLVFTLIGDGECYEGNIWESAMFASHNKLNNLIAFLDHNGISAINFTEQALKLGPMDKKWEAFGWDVVKVDGHSIPEIMDALKDCRNRKSEKPLMIIAKTVKGKGIPFIEDQPLWHSRAPIGDEVPRARAELNREAGK